MEYCVVSAEGRENLKECLTSLAQQVNNLIKDGWWLHGSPSYSIEPPRMSGQSCSAIQAMVRGKPE